MAYPSEYQHFVIAVAGVVGRFDVLLELEDHRAGAVDYPESQPAGDVIYVRGYAVSADEKGLTCHIGQGFKVVEVYWDQTHCPKARDFLFVVHYRPQAEEFLSSAGQKRLCSIDSFDDPSAKTGMGINLDSDHNKLNLPCIKPCIQASSSVNPISELSSRNASSALRSGLTSRCESM